MDIKQMLKSIIGKKDKEYTGEINNTLAAIINNRIEYWNITDPSDVFRHPVVNRSIQFIANNISQLPLLLYKNDQLFEGDPPFDVYRPNDYQSFSDFIRAMITNRVVYREIIVRIQRDNTGRVINIYNIQSNNAQLFTDNTGRISHWEINRERVPSDDIIYIPDITVKGVRPIPLVDIIKDDFYADIKSSEFIRQFFENYAQLGGYLYYDGDGQGPTPEQMQALVDQLNQAHKGSKKAYKLAGLTGGVKYDSVDSNIRDMDFNQSKDSIRDRILLHLGIPKSVVGVTDNVDRAVADTHLRMVWLFTLKPLSEQIAISFNKSIYKPMGLMCRWDYSNVEVLQDNKLNTAELASKYFSSGYSRNEIIEKLGLPFDKDDKYGDLKFVPSSLIPISDMVDTTPTNPPKSLDNSDKLDKIVEKVSKNEEKSRKNRLYERKFHKIRLKHEKLIRSKLKRYLYNQRSEVLKVVYNYNKQKDGMKYTILNDIREVIDNNTKKLIDDMTPLYEAAYRDGLDLANTVIGSEGGVVDDKVIAERINLLKGVNDHDYKMIRDVVVESIRSGDTMDQLADKIKASYNKMSTIRSTMVARTESGALINNSAVKRYSEAGIKYKSWSTPISRESHFENNAQGKIPWDQPFANGQMYPHDGGDAAENINCTCTLIPEL